MEPNPTVIAFAGSRCLASGAPAAVLPVLKRRFDKGDDAGVLIFEVDTGRQVDFDLRGTLDEVLARIAPPTVRGPGRPKLGVASREVTLLPRHWDWLDQQAPGASAALRRLVEQAIRDEPGAQRATRIRAALSRFLGAIAGDRPNYEEATRALFRGDHAGFADLVQRWPKDIREHALQRLQEARAAAA